jgi:aminoglycoside 3-N-acetyltransferase
MKEADLIQKTGDAPVTVESLICDLNNAGIAPGMTLLVHSSLSSLGWVCGGPAAVIMALESVLRSYGTLVMPTHSGDLSDPEGWENPPVPESWWEPIRKTMPAYDPDLTPTRGMGRIAETFRKQRDVVRSSHPNLSFAAWGEKCIQITAGHILENALGETSPLARIYDLDGWVLLLGVDHDANTSLHLAEYRAAYPTKKTIIMSAPVMSEEHRRWQRFNDIDFDIEDFTDIGKAFLKKHVKEIYTGKIGHADYQLFPQRLCVDFAASWMERYRR